NIKEFTRVKPGSKAFVHYTPLKTIDRFANNSNLKFRYYNTAYMNDPEEGEALINYLGSNVIGAYQNAKKSEELNVYLGSFLPAPELENKLVVWRTYGKDENKEEAAGCSVVLRGNFFDQETGEFYNQDKEKIETDYHRPRFNDNLHKVIYLDTANLEKPHHDIQVLDLLKELSISLEEVMSIKKEVEDEKVYAAIDKIIFLMLSELTYFFKSSHYSYENEFRVIKFETGEKVKVDTEAIDLPRKLYVESKRPLLRYIQKVILGPKVKNQNQWQYIDALAKQNGFNVKVEPSGIAFQ
ncbi:MAG TPA: hypothetical protein VFO76_07165, partial [Candidatus Kapabacteria bacterium]|nr:hypothetical protein [Candidatus Kapabacteria bacterium]